jgi:large subunit ribosomal protein L2
MALKTIKPTTPAQRGMTGEDFSMITAKKPLKSLLTYKTRTSGRNNQGKITTRHQGGGARRYYRLVNFQLEPGTEATIIEIEYDPNRSARIARIKDAKNRHHYIIASSTMKPGQKISVGEEVAPDNGNRMPLKNIPLGSSVHAVELQAGRGAQLARSAGTSVRLTAKEGNYAHLRLPSGEVRMVRLECMASLGVVGNEQHQNVKLGKAGKNRHRGIRPTVRGVVMNAVDHPHGGGDGGKHGIGGGKGGGGFSPRTPWGKKTLGYKTRRRKVSNKLIVRSRAASKRR